MPFPRHRQINVKDPGWVHCINRCVRRAFLAGDGYSHRKDWVEERLRELAVVFACDIGAYAVMSNHVHIVVRMDPVIAAGWSSAEVARRWLTLFGTREPRNALGQIAEAVIARYAADIAWVAERRERLSNLSWFMRALSEPIARRANQEDDCSGRFWEGRFTSVPLLDQAALIACMAYVDLNPVRAKLADRPERSTHTAARARIRARQKGRVRERIRERCAGNAAREARELAKAKVAAMSPAPDRSLEPEREGGLWLAPMAKCVVLRNPATPGIDPAEYEASARSLRLTVDQYLTLLDATGRVLREGKRGAIPPELAAILSRLDLKVDQWLASMLGWREMSVGVIGGLAARTAEAARRGTQWVRNHCSLFAGERKKKPAGAAA